MVHGPQLVIPYGISDYATTFATLPLKQVLAAMEQHAQGFNAGFDDSALRDAVNGHHHADAAGVVLIGGVVSVCGFEFGGVGAIGTNEFFAALVRNVDLVHGNTLRGFA